MCQLVFEIIEKIVISRLGYFMLMNLNQRKMTIVLSGMIVVIINFLFF